MSKTKSAKTDTKAVSEKCIQIQNAMILAKNINEWRKLVNE